MRVRVIRSDAYCYTLDHVKNVICGNQCFELEILKEDDRTYDGRLYLPYVNVFSVRELGKDDS